MELHVRHNVMDITGIDAFENIRGGFHGNCKDVYFVRLLGTYQGLTRDIEKMDSLLGQRMQAGNGSYKRIEALPKIVSVEETNFYVHSYQQWLENGKTQLFTKTLSRHVLGATMLSTACKQVVDLYKRGNMQMNAAIEKNFVVKLLFWFDFIMDGLMAEWNERAFVKIVAANIVKKQEYLFFYMLTLVGFDVLLLQNEHDIQEEEERLGLSKKYMLENKKEIVKREQEQKPWKELQKNKKEDRIEKSFEELARLAASVVLITVHDNNGQPIGYGSGIMVGCEGYILTNYHVLCRGGFYTINIENDKQVYQTEEVVKYHSVFDLAVLRIDRKLEPIPVYAGKKALVRGQKVVAIGSPLGLFNSVSDGIISGFRIIDHVDMIQFTAPISNGSSGGALLNMYGEVIGISTAGFDDGQNINLAVGYECIRRFIQGFVTIF